MQIQASSVQLAAQHHLVEKQEKKVQLQAWIGPRPAANAAAPAGQDLLSLSGTAPPPGPAAAQDETAAVDPAHPQLTILRLLLERMTGRRIVVFNPGAPPAAPAPPPTAPAPSGPAGETSNQEQGWGMIYDYHESFAQTESTAFQASGTFRTADGREIAFAVEMTMSREFRQETNISLRAGDALKDPLVLNFSGAPVELTQDKFAFDIDSDGQSEQIGMVKSGSAFLVLDRNQDGQINAGSELFGPSSGDGYQELASYDGDKNGWIDEADPIFKRLQLWTGEAVDARQLLSLGAKGIGAIFLGRVATPFALNNANNELQGMVRESGIFAREDGSVGTIQQIDLVV
ncbi:MAG: VCBS repeat-containing protein [Desulfobulbaceae bacterium]|nr:VCBS repeat-containing protein [Desulfobulbaceae bacterium]